MPYLSALSDLNVQQLAKVLQLRPAEDPISYSNRVLDLIAELPPNLRRPGKICRILHASSHPEHVVSPLCTLHKRLNATAVHMLFTVMALEVGVRLNNLISHSHMLEHSQLARVSRLRELHALWLNPEIYCKTFVVTKEHVRRLKWHFQADGCEACMLARITGDLETLVDLRATLLSRTTSKYVEKYDKPRLMVWVEAWIASLTLSGNGKKLLEDDEFERLITINDEEAKLLKDKRKAIVREKRKSKSTSLKGEQAFEKKRSSPFLGDDIDLTAFAAANADFEPLSQPSAPRISQQPGSKHEVENAFIDHYAALLSTPHLPSTISIQLTPPNKYEFPNHPDRYDSSSISPPSTKATSTTSSRSKTKNHPYLNPHPAPSSIYSNDTVRNNDRVIGRTQPPRPATLREEVEEEYHPPRLNWAKPIQPSSNPNPNPRAQAYHDLLSQPLSPLVQPNINPSGHRHSRNRVRRAAEGTKPAHPPALRPPLSASRESWATMSVAPTSPTGTQLARALKESLAVDSGIGFNSSDAASIAGSKRSELRRADSRREAWRRLHGD